jgi:hypothetical protein
MPKFCQAVRKNEIRKFYKGHKVHAAVMM